VDEIISEEQSAFCPWKTDNRQWVCLVHFAKTCKDVKMAFEVLNEVYLQNFLHRWVVNREMNLMMLINPCLINN